MRISDWSSDVCSSDLLVAGRSGGRGIWRVLDISGRVNLSGGGNDPTPIQGAPRAQSHLAWCWLSVNDLQLQLFGCVRPSREGGRTEMLMHEGQIGRASGRERVCQYV